MGLKPRHTDFGLARGRGGLGRNFLTHTLAALDPPRRALSNEPLLMVNRRTVEKHSCAHSQVRRGLGRCR